VFSGTIGFMYELQWDIDNGVCSTQDTVSVRFNQIPIANPGTGGNECDLDFILNAVPTVGTGTWTIQSGPGTISFSTNANDPVATITVSQSGIYEFLWTEDNNGCISSDFITVNFYEQPVADAGVGGDECDLDFILSAVPSIGTGTWSKQSGPGNISFTSGTANDFDATIAVDAFGAYEFLWTEDNSGCTDSDFVTVNFYEQPVADAGPGGDECDLDFVLGAIPSIGTGTWAKQSGPGNISFTSGTANDFDATISVDAYGTYEFLWTEDNNGCTSSDFITVNFYEQPVADAGSDGTFCDNSIALNATPSVGTGTWSYAPLDGTGSFDDANDFKAEFFGDFGKPYTLTWTETNGICTDNASIIVQIDEEPTASNAGVDQIICGTSTTLEGNDVSTGVGTGQWSFALGGNSDGLGVIDTPTLYNSAISGTEGVAYELEWIISNGVCGVSTDDVTIEFEQAIPPAIISGDSLICMGEVATFIISNADPISYNYTWDTSGLPASTTIIPGSGTPFQFISIQFNEPFSNLPLSVQIEDKTSSCTGPVETIQISVENPIADFTADIIEDCSPLEVVFTNNDIQAGTVYTWNFGDGTAEEISSDAVITHTFINTTGISDLSFNVVLTAERTNGTLVCTDAMNEVVTVNPNVVATVTPSVTEGCSPLQVSFENNSIGALTNKWFWREQGTTDENDITDTFFATFHLRNTSTATKVYEVIYQGTRNTCSSEVITEITIHPELVADFTVSPGNNILITDPVITTTNISTDKAVWDNLWEWGDGNTTTEIDPTPYTYTAFGQYELKLTLSDPNTTCTSEKIEIINVEPVPPEVDFTWDVSEGCRPLTVTFTNLSVSVDPDTYQWEFMDERGFVLGTSNLENPIMTFNSAGIITVSLSGSNPLGIVDTETKMEIIEVYEIPTAAFVVSPAIVYLPDQVLYTSNRSTLADMFEWDFDGDGVTDSEEFEPQYLYGSPGVYDIGLIAYNSATTCSDTVIVAKAVEVVDKGTAAVPNAFFPESGLGGTGGTGGPGAGNVVFLPRIKGIGDDGYLMQIFDRWGHLLFQTNDKNEGWNGRNSDGRLYPAGVYVYKLDLTYESGEKTTVVGDVTLIR
ncbi:MAG: gliding motility-associated C-terminal domain-containing protein, partial [Bacteroidota bacterium]